MTSRPCPRTVTAKTVAAALLFTTAAASAFVNVCRSSLTFAWRSPRFPVAISNSTSTVDAAWTRASVAEAERTALPKFVWRSTPVALITRVIAWFAGMQRRMTSWQMDSESVQGVSPALIRCRVSAMTSRMIAASLTCWMPCAFTASKIVPTAGSDLRRSAGVTSRLRVM